MTTLEKIKSRCEEVADCWIWQGYTTQTGYPMAKIGGKVQLVRRAGAHQRCAPHVPLRLDERGHDRARARRADLLP